MVNRPTTTSNYRPTTVNNTTTNNISNTTNNISNTSNISNIRQSNVYQNNRSLNIASNQANFINRPGYGSVGWGSNGAWYGSYHHLHDDWHHGGWNYWGGAPPLGSGVGSAFGWLGATATALSYVNPYCAASATPLATSFLDYSQPISVPTAVWADVAVPAPVPTDSGVPAYGQGLTTPPPFQDSQYPPNPQSWPDTGSQPAAPPSRPGGTGDADAQQAAQQTFGDARAAFLKGDYATAQDLAEQALRNLPGDPTLHEFRALTLFAQANYRDAAAAIYAVLAAGPGWNWDTVKALYPDAATYTAQLRALEDYQKKHADTAEASFLLAYHYLTLGSTEAAIKMLRQTVSANPKDTLSPQLLKMLTQAPATDDRPQPGK